MNRSRWPTLLLIGLSCAPSCRPAPKPSPKPVEAAAPPSARDSSSGPQSTPPEPVRVDVLDPAERPPTFVLRGARGARQLVFLHGLCGHAQGYVQSFQIAAAGHGPVVAPQGDVLCGNGPFSSWSGDVVKLDRRITGAFAALGVPEASDVTVIG